MKLSTIFFSALLLLSDAQDSPLRQSSGRGLGRRKGDGERRGGGDGGGGGGRGGWGKDRDGGGHGGGGGIGGRGKDRDGGGRGGEGGRAQGGRGKGDRGGRYRGSGRGKRLFSTRKIKMRGICYWGSNESQPLLDRIQEECDSNNPCDGVEPDQLDICTNPSWETMGDGDEDFTFGECSGERLTDDQRAELKTKMQANKETRKSRTDAERIAFKEQKEDIKASNKATVLLCGCCKGTASIATLVKDREFAVAKTLGFRRPRGDLEEKCAAFVEEDGCTAIEEEADGPVDCDWFDSANGERGLRLKKRLYCGCCRDPIDDFDPVDPGGD